MKISIKYGSHLPVLTKLIESTTGPVLELGIGLYSTPYLHYSCTTARRELTSYESEHGWYKYFKDCRNDYHQLNYIEDWNTLPIDKMWDVAFIDNGPDETRKDQVKKLANNAKYLILHDSDPENDYLYKYSEIYPLFKYRFNYDAFKPNTTVLSNFVSLEGIW